MIKQQVLLIGSVPMSLSELQLAPALIGAAVQNLGHAFQYHDINLMLFECCDRDHSEYVQAVETLQDKQKWHHTTPIIDTWLQYIDRAVQKCDVLLINVFSMFSHLPAMRLAQRYRAQHRELRIIMGGLGCSKPLLGGVASYLGSPMADLVAAFDDHTSFGDICQQLRITHDWQQNADMDVLQQHLSVAALKTQSEFDYGCYDLDSYVWPHGQRAIPMLGSHGCVRQCSFCDVIKYFPRYNYIEADALTKSIVEAHRQTGISRIQFMDSLVNGSMSNFLMLLKNLAQARQAQWLPREFSWSGTYICRPPSTQLAEIHDHLAASGADNLVIGVETGSDRVRWEMEKKFTNQDLMQEIAAFDQQQVKCSLLFFPSWPTETQADFESTLRLFTNLAGYGQKHTVDSVNLGTNGFALIDGTGIDRDRDRIELEPGPLPWLWRCGTNSDLTFYETLRRRFAMAEWCEMMGIRLDGETESRRHLAFNLEHHQGIIRDYCGQLHEHIDFTSSLPTSIWHELTMHVINSGSAKTTVTLAVDDHICDHVCMPGTTQVRFRFQRRLDREQQLDIGFRFDPHHQTYWDTYTTGDFYDRNGLYLDKIMLDDRDITFWGWQHAVDIDLDPGLVLPDGYFQHRNVRCVTAGMRFRIMMPVTQSAHKVITRRQDQAAWADRVAVDARIERCLQQLAS